MSAGLPYLQRQRKSELTDLASSVGLKNYEPLKKTELEVALDEHLRANQTTYADNPDLQDYFKRFTSRTSPVKAAEEKKPRARRQTLKAAEEPTSDSDAQGAMSSTTLIPRTPLSNLQLAQRVRNLPPSPAAITDAIETQTNKLRTSINSAWSESGVTEAIESTREALSSVTTIEMFILLLEVLYLRPEVLPDKYVFTIPSNSILHTDEIPVKLPDLFKLVSSDFWAPFSLWLLTSVLIPLFFAYFFNLSLKTKGTRAHPAVPFKFDPLIFNVAKGLIGYFVYARHFQLWELYDAFTIERVVTKLPGGWPGLIIGAAIGGVGSVYEAILRK